MRLASYSKDDRKSIGVELPDGVLDIPSAAAQFGIEHEVHGYNFPVTMIDLLRWVDGIVTVRGLLESYLQSPSDERPELLRIDELRFMAPISRPGKIIGLGLNYRDHAEETGESVPEFPQVFAKFPSSVTNPDDDIPIPKVTKKLDWEVELGIVIGRMCKEVSANEALNYLAGYTFLTQYISSVKSVKYGHPYIHKNNVRRK